MARPFQSLRYERPCGVPLVYVLLHLVWHLGLCVAVLATAYVAVADWLERRPTTWVLAALVVLWALGFAAERLRLLVERWSA